MHPLSLLHVHTTPYLNKTEQAPEVAMERICVDDAAEDDIPHSQSQPQVTSSGGLLRVMNSNAAQVIKRPASAPPVFSHPGLDSSRHDAGEETFIDNMNNLRNIRVGYVYVTVPRARLARLLAWRRRFSLWLLAGASLITLYNVYV